MIVSSDRNTSKYTFEDANRAFSQTTDSFVGKLHHLYASAVLGNQQLYQVKRITLFRHIEIIPNRKPCVSTFAGDVIDV